MLRLLLGAVEELCRRDQGGILICNTLATHLEAAALVCGGVREENDNDEGRGVDVPAVYRLLRVGNWPWGGGRRRLGLNLVVPRLNTHLKLVWPLWMRMGCGASGTPARLEMWVTSSGDRHRSSMNLDRKALGKIVR